MPFLMACLAAGPPSPPDHVFRKPSDGWLSETRELQVQPDGEGFIVVKPESRPGFTTLTPGGRIHSPAAAGLHQELRYFATSEDQKTSRYVKLQRYSPAGRLEEETDWENEDQFTRSFYEDGTLATYTHLGGLASPIGRWIDGHSTSPSGKTTSAFSGGKGDLIEWRAEETTFKHHWYHDGAVYLERRVAKGTLEQTMLFGANSDTLTVSNDAESLVLSSLHETWTRKPHPPPAEGEISAQVMDSYIDADTGQVHQQQVEEDAIKARIRKAWGWVDLRPRPRGEWDALVKQLARDYASRRADFLRVYGELITKAGQSWRSLDLESLGR
jgi:hypothetical protein